MLKQAQHDLINKLLITQKHTFPGLYSRQPPCFPFCAVYPTRCATCPIIILNWMPKGLLR
jgi:hypothetical protein